MIPIQVSTLSLWRRLSIVALVAVLYFLGAAFGLSLATLAKQVSPVWPPTGIALAALLLLGRGVWPGIAIGAFAINALTGPLPAAMGIAVGNTLEAIVGAELLRRYVGFRCAFDRPRDIIGLVVCSAMISTTVSATLGVASLCLNSVEPWSNFGALWWTWWLGDAMGALIVAPLLLIGVTWLRSGQEPKRPMESALFIAVVVVVSFFVLGGGGGSPLELKYLVIPLFVWSALRLGQMPTATGLAVSAGFVIYWINLMSQVAKPDDFNAHLLLMQSFLGVLFVGSLTLGAVVAEHERISMERDTLLESEQAARAEAEKVARLKDDFVATLSHELRTPLNGLLGWTQVLKRGGRDPAVVSEGLAAVERCARTLAQLIDDLMDMTRSNSGKMSIRLQPVRLSAIIENAVEMMRPEASAKKIELAMSILDNSVVSGDPARLQQVLCNLLSNALKFTPSNGRVAVKLAQDNGHTLLTVQDTGLGINPEFLPHIFDRFRQADGSTTRRFGGLGLGLAIVKHIVQLHGGTVAAHSLGLGHGATISLRIPQAAEAADEMSNGFMEAGWLSGTRILVVDDDRDACELLGRVLSEFGAEVLTAQSVDEALAQFSAHPHLLLSDIGLPGRDGYQLIREVRDYGEGAIREMPSIAVTAFTRPEDRDRAIQAGYDAHVGKPVDMGELLTAVARVLRRPAPPRAVGAEVATAQGL